MSNMKEDDKKKVKISVDNHPEHVPPGVYQVSELKALIGISAEKELDQVIDGNLTTLDDNASISVRGDEVFFSHARRGGSS